MTKAEAEVLSIDGHQVHVTHPNKLYFSKQARFTKLDLVRYYLSVASGALNGIQDRRLIEPRSSRLFDAAANGTELLRAVSIGRNCNQNSCGFDQTDVFGGKIEPIRARVYFKEALILFRMRDDPLDIQFVAGPLQ